MRSLVLAVVVVFSVIGAIAGSRIYGNYNSRPDMVKGSRAPASATHEVVFNIQLKNMKKLTSIVDDISNPKSPNYGQHLSRDEVVEMVGNSEAVARLRDFLSTHHQSGLKVVKEMGNKQRFTVSAPISVWESVFDTEFYEFHRTAYDGGVDKTVLRALSYEIPALLVDHVSSVMNTVQMPPTSKPAKTALFKGLTKVSAGPPIISEGSVTPALLNQFCKRD